MAVCNGTLYYYASHYRRDHDNTLYRYSINDDKRYAVVEGDAVLWSIDRGSCAVYVRDFDQTRTGEYLYNGLKNHNPRVMMRCTQDCSIVPIEVKNMAGVTLYTFSEDHSSKHCYIVLRLDDNNDWILA